MSTTTINTTTTVEIEDIDGVVDKTVFLYIGFNRFGNKKTADVEVKTDAKQSRFSKQKTLLECPELKAIERADSAIRLLVNAYCIPYMEGVRLVPWKNVPKLLGILKNYQKNERPLLVEACVNVYDEQVKQAQFELKEHFNQLDFPNKEQFRKEFSFVFQFKSFSTPDKLATLDPSAFDEEKEKAKELLKSATEEFVVTLRSTAYDLVSGLLDKLSSSEDGRSKSVTGGTG